MAIYYNGHQHANKGGGSSGGGGIDYSTTEQDTGVKWIDGKPIYQKTIHFETPISISSSGTGLSDSYFSGMNIAQVIRAEVVIPYSSGSGMGTSPINFWERPNNQGYKVYVMSSWDNVEWLNIWYTKTTDTV